MFSCLTIIILFFFSEVYEVVDKDKFYNVIYLIWEKAFNKTSTREKDQEVGKRLRKLNKCIKKMVQMD